MGDLFDFERGLIVGVCLAEAPVRKTASLLGVSRETVSKVMLAHTNHGKTTSEKRSSKGKSTLTERDRCTLRRSFEKSTTTVQVTAELNTHPDDPVSTKTVECELHKSSIHGKTANC
jgi:IS30 family transposase